MCETKCNINKFQLPIENVLNLHLLIYMLMITKLLPLNLFFSVKNCNIYHPLYRLHLFTILKCLLAYL